MHLLGRRRKKKKKKERKKQRAIINFRVTKRFKSNLRLHSIQSSQCRKLYDRFLRRKFRKQHVRQRESRGFNGLSRIKRTTVSYFCIKVQVFMDSPTSRSFHNFFFLFVASFLDEQFFMKLLWLVPVALDNLNL